MWYEIVAWPYARESRCFHEDSTSGEVPRVKDVHDKAGALDFIEGRMRFHNDFFARGPACSYEIRFELLRDGAVECFHFVLLNDYDEVKDLTGVRVPSVCVQCGKRKDGVCEVKRCKQGGFMAVCDDFIWRAYSSK